MWLPSLAGTANSFQTSSTTITADATVHTKGSWVQLVASTPFDVTMIIVGGGDTGTSGTNTAQLTDIGVGANPNEKVSIANIPTGYGSLDIVGNRVATFPVAIPSGTRISARMQATITVDIVDIRLYMFGGSSWSSLPTFQTIDTIGAVTASSSGTSISGGSIVEMIASTAEDYKALGYGVDGGGASSMSNATPNLELFVGAGAAEKTLIDNILIQSSTTEKINRAMPSQGILPIELDIPAGSRLSAQQSGTSNFGLVLYGFR